MNGSENKMQNYTSARKTKNHHGKNRGSFASEKMNRRIPYVSVLERDFIYLLECDSNVLGYSPFEIPYTYGPNFLCKLAAGNSQLIQLTYSSKINDEKNKAESKIIESYCYENGWQHKIMTEENLNKNQLKNLKILSVFRFPRPNTEEIFGYVKEILTIQKKLSIAELANQLSDKADFREILPIIYHLIYKNKIKTDIKDELIDSNAIVCLSNEGETK